MNEKSWLEKRLPIKGLLNKVFGDYPVPKKPRYWSLFGWLALFLFFVVLKTGVFLSLHYTPSQEGAFASVQHIIRNVDFGWLIQSIHKNGTSFLFFLVYAHFFKSIYYRSYRSPREIAWITGVVALIIMMACAFSGYVLVWGQMSFWATTVITNLFSEVPFVGEHITQILRGGENVGTNTIKRFYTIHMMAPFGFLLIGVIHIWASRSARKYKLQEKISRTPKGYVPFHPFYSLKILTSFAILLTLLSLVVFYFPDIFSNMDNNIKANPMKTPEHLAPEWYFLPFYGILRSASNSFLGVFLMFGSLIVLFFVPWLDNAKRNSQKVRKFFNIFYILFVLDCLLLGVVGKMPAIGFWLLLARISTIYYFSFFLIVMPALKIKGQKT